MTMKYVDFTTDIGDIIIQLYDDIAPQVTQNFLSYAQNMTIGNGYEDSLFDYLVPGYVLRGGGYNYSSGSVSLTMTSSSVVNEFDSSHPNTEGTVSLFIPNSSPDSGTDEFSINLADNSETLDSLNGGFTVFGTITPSSWPVVAEIASLPVVDAGAPFENLPVQGTLNGGVIDERNLVIITDVRVSDTPPCYRRGTRIKTIQGDRSIELLQIGDRVVSARGEILTIRWLGHRHVNCRSHRHPECVWPVIIKANAFAVGRPIRDLWLSPDHSLFVQDVLIPVKHLINGRTIIQKEVEEVEYWHVELDRHDVLFAEGLPAESYLDTGNRTAFANGGAAIQLHPDFNGRSWTDACAQLLQEGPRLVKEKMRLFHRAGILVRDHVSSLAVFSDDLQVIPNLRCSGISEYLIPLNARSLRLRSPVTIPAHCVADSLDRRRLGIRLFEIMIDGYRLALDSPHFFCGFYSVELTREGVCRWTDGDARLVLPVGASQVVLRLDVGVATMGEKVRHCA